MRARGLDPGRERYYLKTSGEIGRRRRQGHLRNKAHPEPLPSRRWKAGPPDFGRHPATRHGLTGILSRPRSRLGVTPLSSRSPCLAPFAVAAVGSGTMRAGDERKDMSFFRPGRKGDGGKNHEGHTMTDHRDVDQEGAWDEELERWCREMECRLNAPPEPCAEGALLRACAGCCGSCGPPGATDDWPLTTDAFTEARRDSFSGSPRRLGLGGKGSGPCG